MAKNTKAKTYTFNFGYETFDGTGKCTGTNTISVSFSEEELNDIAESFETLSNDEMNDFYQIPEDIQTEIFIKGYNTAIDMKLIDSYDQDATIEFCELPSDFVDAVKARMSSREVELMVETGEGKTEFFNITVSAKTWNVMLNVIREGRADAANDFEVIRNSEKEEEQEAYQEVAYAVAVILQHCQFRLLGFPHQAFLEY